MYKYKSVFFSIQHPHVTQELLFFPIDTHTKFHVSYCGIASIQYSTRKSRGEKKNTGDGQLVVTKQIRKKRKEQIHKVKRAKKKKSSFPFLTL